MKEEAMDIPKDLLYTKDHEWIRIDGDIATVGITDFAQGELGDVVFVQLPDAGAAAVQGESFGSIEAVKAVADIYAPVSGEIIEVNQALTENPEKMNESPYEDGWIVKIKVSNLDAEKAALLNPDAYSEIATS